MRIVHDNETAARLVYRFCGEKVEGPIAGLVISNDGGPVGAVIVSDWREGNCEISAVGRWLCTPMTLREVFRYVFGKLRCRRVTIRFRPDNAMSLKAVKVLGFQVEGRLRDWYGPGEDAIVCGLLAREQKIVRV